MVMWDEIGAEIGRSRREFPDVTWGQDAGRPAMTMRMDDQAREAWIRSSPRNLHCRHFCPIWRPALGGLAGHLRRPPISIREAPLSLDVRTNSRLGVRHCRQGKSPIRSARSGLGAMMLEHLGEKKGCCGSFLMRAIETA